MLSINKLARAVVSIKSYQQKTEIHKKKSNPWRIIQSTFPSVNSVIPIELRAGYFWKEEDFTRSTTAPRWSCPH